ncbi:hypothetical protein [Pedobacter sp. V48]|uniref:hypothetical protein n=1 Tax=Pedobacter sp. V48 TaxID=509635 RepID=UPI0003E49842|nr:hypothetical protein [Pedobacter sp. V48]ETZ24009.1 hypothetical protein N824_15840 [Pedobacter sp. V48]
MEQKKWKVSLAAKVLGGAVFLTVFIFNAVTFIEKDGGSFSLNSLKAYAQTGGGGSEELAPCNDPNTEGCSAKLLTTEDCSKPYVKTQYYNSFNQLVGASLYIDGHFTSSYGTAYTPPGGHSIVLNGFIGGTITKLACPMGTTVKGCYPNSSDCILSQQEV